MINFIFGAPTLTGLILGAAIGAGGWAFYSANFRKQ